MDFNLKRKRSLPKLDSNKVQAADVMQQRLTKHLTFRGGRSPIDLTQRKRTIRTQPSQVVEDDSPIESEESERQSEAAAVT